MIDFDPLLRALLEAAVFGTAIYLLIVGREGISRGVWAVAIVIAAGLYGLLTRRHIDWAAYPSELSLLPSVIGPVAGSLASIAIGISNRDSRLRAPFAIPLSIVGYYFAGLLVRLALFFVL